MSEAERWTRVKEIFDAAVAGRVEDRAALVRDMCGDDRALQADVESLLAADAGNGSVFDAVGRSRHARTRVRARSPASSTTGPTRSRRASVSEPTRSPDSSGPAAWAASIGPATRRSAATSRSRSCPISGWPIPSGARASSARRACWPSLNHPNIGSIYGVHEGEPSTSSGLAVKALVLELVEGETLADRIALQAQPSTSRRGLPIDEVVSHRGSGDRGARGGARARHRAPGPQAGQHQDHARRAREGARLRPRQGRWAAPAAARRSRIHRRSPWVARRTACCSAPRRT